LKILHGDCREVLATLPAASVDSIVTDPPYELGFMGKGWDQTGVANDPATWAAAFRVLKPGGHLLAFSGTRTYHRMVCAIEDAGFEIRDQIGWLYGSGFPKSLDVSKAIDKAAGALGARSRGFNAAGVGESNGGSKFRSDHPEYEPYSPATDAARQWQGWGTALKPAWEPIVVARKPLIGTVAANVLQHGTGALNIDGCRVATADDLNGGAYSAERKPSESEWVKHGGTIHSSTGEAFVQPPGRWPANIIHDGSEEVLAAFPQTVAATSRTERSFKGWKQSGELTRDAVYADGGGSAARFFKECKWDSESSDQPASDAASRSDSCETSTADTPAAPPTSRSPGSPPTPASTSASRSSTPTPSRAPAGLWDSTDTTPTTPTLCESNGSAPPAIDASINSARKAAAAADIDRGQGTRFWYSAKASRYDRNDGTYDLPAKVVSVWGGDEDDLSAGKKSTKAKGNHHPTVKPTDLMRYLCRLVTPPGGTVLDPFMGSGSTLKAAELEGFDAIGIELDEGYIEIARRRIASDAPLFAEVL
jgi:DNA modification methylase